MQTKSHRQISGVRAQGDFQLTGHLQQPRQAVFGKFRHDYCVIFLWLGKASHGNIWKQSPQTGLAGIIPQINKVDNSYLQESPIVSTLNTRRLAATLSNA
jgi:hypothetical protein